MLPVFALLVLILTGLAPLSVLKLYLLGLSALAFVVYVHDKRQAVRGRRRVPEALLHTLSLAGGAPGAALARHLVRHKTLKPFFGLVIVLGLLGDATALFPYFPAMHLEALSVGSSKIGD
ncbi:DUF1294 domain-containing protein [Paraburkholderia sp. UCT31]|nr:DUF1294 domain-containing protein [Paraburkholderia sp. UCT31]